MTCVEEHIYTLFWYHIASWISFEFANNVSVIIQDFSAKYYKANYEATQDAILLSDLQLSNNQQALSQVLQEKTLLEQEHTALQEDHSFAEKERIAVCNTINKQRSKMYNWSDGNGFAILKKNNKDALLYYAYQMQW